MEECNCPDQSMEDFFNVVLPVIDNLENARLESEEICELYSLVHTTFIGMARRLASEGWTVEDLVKEVEHHAADQIESEQSIQAH